MSAPAVVIVSPHLDDAVLSASRQLARPGARLVTVCTAVPSPQTPSAWWDRLTGAASAAGRAQDRLVEDDLATAELGVTDSVRLDFPDGQHVPAGAPQLDPAEVADALRPHLSGASEVWVPAGIGCHPDHLAVRDAGRLAVEASAVVHHYADVPYSLRYGWPPSVTGQPAVPFLDVEAWLHQEAVDAGLVVAEMTRSVHVLDDGEQRRKVAAMARYRTQIPALDYGRVLADGDATVVGFEVSWSRS